MRTRLLFPILLAAAAMLFLASPLSLAEPDEPDPIPSASVTKEKLEAKIAETEAASGLVEEAKKELLGLYREALVNLEAAESDTQSAEEYSRIVDTAPARIEVLREAVADLQTRDPAGDLDAALSDPLPQLDQRLQKEKTDLAAARAQRSDADNQVRELSARPGLIGQRLVFARKQQEELAAQLGLPPPEGEDPATTEAREWVLESSLQALNAEIGRLDQELLSQPVRLDLQELERDKALANKEWLGKRVEILEDLVNQKRAAEAGETLAQAEAIRDEAEGKHPMVVRLAERNAVLSEEIAGSLSVLGRLTEQAEQARKQARRIETDFKTAQETIDIGGLSRELGQMLLQQRHQLPDLRSFRREAEEREAIAARIGVRRLNHRQEQRRLGDMDAYLASLVTAEAGDISQQLDAELRGLAGERQAILERAIESDDLYLGKLGELESTQQLLYEQVKGFDEFMDEHLLWVRSSSPAELAGIGASPEEVWRILSPKGWLEVGRSLLHQVTHAPVFALLVLVLAALLWWRKRIVAAIPPLGASVGKPRVDRFSYSVQAFVLTLIVAAGLPLLMLVTGWQLKVSSEGARFSLAVGGALMAAAAQVFFLRALRMANIDKGLAASHYRWPAARVRLLRTELDRMTWIFLPAFMVAAVAVQLDPLNGGWAIGRVAFLVLVGSLSFAFYRLLHPVKGIFASPSGRESRRTTLRLRWLGYLALVAAPLVLGIIVILGYLLAVRTLFGLLLETTWLLITVWLLWELARRWLLIAQRRLVYEAAVEERRARWAAKHEQEEEHTQDHAAFLEMEEPQIDLVALSETGQRLLNTVFVFLGVVGLWMIWSDVFAALRVLDDVTLWHQTAVVDGEEQLVPVTLADIGLAAIYVLGTVVLMKQLPAVLEIILLHSTEMTAPGRYTATTMTNYLIVTAGAILVSTTIGVEWSKLQWLVAALGVGIGFGLQEIVANFISGLIILFERPIRVGDIVTVGDTDGVVTKIRIRATTIRNWDRKELLVPNKEFITGRLLNWSLSDQVMRIVVVVGVAYEADVDKAHELMIEAAKENEYVIQDPGPVVSFEGFGDNALTLLLRAYIDNLDHRLATVTMLHKAINTKFRQAGISIAFPQRDLHLNTLSPLQVEVVGAGQAPSGEVK
ncbi:MAG: mechanosensitive ion channel domain-containing protein [Sedimenticolaceae bacterium]